MKKKLKKIPIWVIVVICVTAGLVIASVVCLILVKNAEAEDLRKAKETTAKILETRAAMETYLNTEAEDAKLDSFESEVEKAGGYLRDLGESRVVEEGKAKELFEEASEKMGDLQLVGETEQLLKDIIDDNKLSDEEVEQLANSGSKYLQELAQNYKEYRAKLAEFMEKYADLKGKNKTELDADYAAIQQEGNVLAQKYTEIKFDDVYGKSRDDILSFYATIEELNKFLAEKN